MKCCGFSPACITGAGVMSASWTPTPLQTAFTWPTLASRTTNLPRGSARASVSEVLTLTCLRSEEIAQPPEESCLFAALAHTGRRMSDLSVSAARSRLDDVVDDACANHEYLPDSLGSSRGCGDRRRGSGVPLSGCRRIEAADAARAEIAERGTIPWNEVKAERGLA